MSHVESIESARPARPTHHRAPGRGVGRLGSWVAAAPALITDGAVVAFALWTVLYHAAFLFSLAPSVTFAIWLVGCLALVAAAVWRRRRRATDDDDPGRPDDSAPPLPSYPKRWLVVVVAAACVAAITAGMRRFGLPWWVTAAFGLVAAIGAMLLVRRAVVAGRLAGARAPVTPQASPRQSAYALGVSVLVGISSWFLARNTPDDVYYVGKSVWVAQRDEVPLRDFLFTEGVAPPLSSQPPIASIEVFAGALGRTLGIHAASATWYVLLPILAILAVLALWRLVHRWAPRRAILAFTVAVGFLYLVAGPDAALGTFHLPRLHEGKGMFVSAVVPLMWLYLTEWLDRRSRRALMLIVALSIAATGLTSTAVIILPLLAGAGALAMCVVGRWRDAMVCLAAIVAYPLGAAVVSQLLVGPVSTAAGTTQFFDAEGTYQRTLMIGALGVICGIALWLGPFTVRWATPALFAAGCAVTMTVLLVPGVLEMISAGTGLSAVLWRVPWLLPLPALVGMLCTIDVAPLRASAGGEHLWAGALRRVASAAEPLRRGVGLATAAALLAAFAIFGAPMWSTRSHVEVHPRPTWKLLQQRQKLAFWMVGLDRPPGLLLAPSTLMRTVPIVTSEVRVVMARNGYLIEYGWTSQFSQDRLKLAAFADGTGTTAVPELAAAMDRLDVSVVCVYASNTLVPAAASELRLVQFASREAPGAMRCYRRAG